MSFFYVVNSSCLNPKEINFLEGTQGDVNAHGAFPRELMQKPPSSGHVSHRRGFAAKAHT